MDKSPSKWPIIQGFELKKKGEGVSIETGSSRGFCMDSQNLFVFWNPLGNLGLQFQLRYEVQIKLKSILNKLGNKQNTIDYRRPPPTPLLPVPNPIKKFKMKWSHFPK
jgi:hypothetical protein